MAVKSKARWCLALVQALIVGLAHAAPITVTVGTGNLQGVNAQLAFDLLQGVPAPNSVTISDFETDGELGSSNLPSVGLSGGPLPDDLTLTLADDTDFFVEYLQFIKLGTYITFTFDASGSAAATSPAGFSFFILDPDPNGDSPFLVETGDPTGANALFLYSIGNPSPFETFPPFSNGVTVTQVSDVPEPGALALAVSALLAIGFVRRTRKAPPRRR